MLQRELARLFAVETATITNWEKDRTKPRLRYLTKIVQFLGYSPLENAPKTMGERLLYYRRIRGIKQNELALRIGIDPTTLSRIEWGRGKSMSAVQKKVNLFLRGIGYEAT